MPKKSLGFTQKQVSIDTPITTFYDTVLTIAPTASFIALIILFVISGVAAVFIGQIIARLLNIVGIHYAITIWLVPAAPIAVVFLFRNIFKQFGVKL